MMNLIWSANNHGLSKVINMYMESGRCHGGLIFCIINREQSNEKNSR